MMDELWVLFLKCVTAVLISLMLVIGGCVTKRDMLIVDMVKAGADPLAAQCAIASTSNYTCLIISAKKGA